MKPKARVLLDRLGAAKVALLRRMPERFHAITDEVAKFGTIGLINLGVNFAVFNALLVAVSGSEVKAKAAATVVAATCAYFLNRYWTYRHRPKTTLRREYSLFFLFNAVGLVIETGIVAVAKYGFDYTSLAVLNILTFVGIGIGTVFRFWAYRTHVFKKEVPAASAGEEPPAEAPAPQAAQAETPGTTPTPANAAPPAAATTVEGPKVDEDGQDDLNDELVEIELDQILRLHERVRR